MKKDKTKVTYDADADVVSFEVAPKAKIDYASEVGDFVVHFTKQNKPVLVELLNATGTLNRTVKLMDKAVNVGSYSSYQPVFA